MPEKNRRLILDNEVVYPITRHENIIGLQKTIKEKLPIISSETPEEFVDKQVWIDTSEQAQQEDVLPRQVLLNLNGDIENNYENNTLSLPSTADVENNFGSSEIENNYDSSPNIQDQTTDIENNYGPDHVAGNENTTIEDNYDS